MRCADRLLRPQRSPRRGAARCLFAAGRTTFTPGRGAAAGERGPVERRARMTGRIGLISRDESSLDVRLLHQALAALGQPAAPAEVEAGKAGADTQAKGRALPGRLNIPGDPSVLVARTTQLAREDALRAHGLLAARP